jgi:hypothetical protein
MFGLKKMVGTNEAISLLNGKIIKALDARKKCFVVYLDLQNGFFPSLS